MPIEKVYSFLFYLASSLAKIDAVKEESKPPDNSAPIGLSDLILSVTAFVNTSLIFFNASSLLVMVIGIF